jgi:uncharacterized membrane protein YkgB
MLDHNSPPLRLDKSFLYDTTNRRKLIQLIFGVVALIVTLNCFPNTTFPFCTNRIHEFSQLFNIVCVNAFFFVVTALLTLAHLFSMPDAYYHYNFPLLEKFFCTLAAGMYAIAVCVVLAAIARSQFAFAWMLDLTATSAVFVVYLIDCLSRWRNPTDMRTLS